MNGQTLAHYRILEKIGAGGMSEVYRARDTKLDRDVAVKLLPRDMSQDPERLRRFEREAKTLAALQHPNIITVHSVEESDGIRYMTMELLDGRSLRALIPKDGFAQDRLFALVMPVVDALRAAHEKGITHRDLKPGNIMVIQQDRVKILDFGLAKFENYPPARHVDEDTTEELTADGLILGTVPYMSPEQVQGKPVDYRSDIFSLGILLYEMATGRRPFCGDNWADLVSSILRDHPPPVTELRPDLPERLARVVDRCLEKRPDARGASTAALYDELAKISKLPPVTPMVTPAIAVLPFVDMSPDKDQEYFCEGLAEELINNLTRIGGLQVASRTSAFTYRDSAADIREIGVALGVQTVLEGSVRRAGDRLRITAQLIDVSDGFHLWSDGYDCEIQDIFTIQERIARSIVESLRVSLTPSERHAIQAPATTDVQAFDYYLRGRKFFYGYGRKSIELALRMFSMAIKHDAAYARAYAGIADCCCYLFLYADRSRASLSEADKASLKALELDPESAEAHASRGQVLSLDGRHAEAEAEFETALQLEPRLFEAHYLYARDCFAQGKLEPAAQLFMQAAELSPEDYQALLLVAQIYDTLGRESDAVDTRRRGVRVVEDRLKQSPGDVRALYMGANGLMALGEHEQGLEWASLALSMEPGEPMVLYNVACIYALGGRAEEAIDQLERAARTGLTQKGWYLNDSNLDSLRDHPRFKALLDWLE